MKLNFEESKNALEELKQINVNVHGSEHMISYLLKQKIICPVILGEIPQGIEIYRARKNWNGEEFCCKNQISYNRNLDTINIGRANRHRQSIFYGTHKLETSLFECSTFTSEKKNLEFEEFTIGRWRINYPIKVIALIDRFNSQNGSKNNFSNYKKIVEGSDIFQNPDAKKHLAFFSKEFAKPTDRNLNEYKISSEYFNHCLESYDDHFGFLFPSVGFEYNDINIALLPEAVDNFLSLNMVVKYRIDYCQTQNKIYPISIGDINSFEMRKA